MFDYAPFAMWISPDISKTLEDSEAPLKYPKKQYIAKEELTRRT